METFKAPFKGRSLLNWIDWSPDEIETLLDIACTVKAEAKRGEVHARFAGKTIALIFEKRSTRTRSAFESAFGEEGGHPVFMSTQDIQLGAKESVKDTARVLGRMFNAIEFRGFKQEHAEELAHWSGVPVINGLTDAFHPTQALADVMTLKERFETLKGLKWCFCGDGRNNVARSLMLISAKLGIDFSVYSQSGATITLGDDKSVVRGADCLYTDVWVSMGEEALKDARTKLLSPFRVTEALMSETGKSTSVFMHCLPAVKGEEVSEAVFESKASIVWDEAENRKHTIKAIMLGIM